VQENVVASVGAGGVELGYMTPCSCLTTTSLYDTKVESIAKSIGPINLWKKLTGKRSAGNPHAAFDVVGVGNGLLIPRQSSTLPARG